MVAKYPVDISDQEGIVDAVNYLLSGPGGLGQDFNGYAAWTPAWLTGNFRTPYTVISYNGNCTGNVGEDTVLAAPGFNVVGLTIGLEVVGYGIAPGTTLTTIGDTDSTGTILTLSNLNTNDIDNNLTFQPVNKPQLYVAAIALSGAEWLDGYTWKYTFASTQPAPPFALGNNISVSGVTPSDYNGDFSPVGVVECTTDYVIARTNSAYPDPGPGTGGSVNVYWTSTVPTVYALSTDCNSKITVTGGTDRVFIAAQLNNVISYTATTSSDLNYAVAINRYRGFPNSNPTNPGFYFQADKLISKKIYPYPGLNGTGTLDNVETVFSTLVDKNIPPGYYWYILDVSFQVTNGGDLQVTQNDLGLRSMTTQVVKQ